METKRFFNILMLALFLVAPAYAATADDGFRPLDVDAATLMPSKEYVAKKKAKIQKIYQDAFDAKFTALEGEFLRNIPKEATAIIKQKIVENEKLYNCIGSYLQNPNSCPFGALQLQSIKEAYTMYKNFYMMGNFKDVTRSYVLLPGGVNEFRIDAAFSQKSLRLNLNTYDKMKSLRGEDDAFIQSKLGKECGLSLTDKDKFYNMQMGQIITSLPVVLFIEQKNDEMGGWFGSGKKHSEIEDDDIVAAFQELLQSLNKTYDKFDQVGVKDLEGMFVYQGLAQLVISRDKAKWTSVHASIDKKVNPQNWKEHITYFMKNTLFTLNTLFIGCAVIAAGTGAGIVALGCSIAATVSQGAQFIQAIGDYNQAYAEFVAGVNTWDNVSDKMVAVQVQALLTGFNMWALKEFAKGLSAREIASISAWLRSIKSSTDEALIQSRLHMHKYLIRFTKETSTDYIRGNWAAPYGLQVASMATRKQLMTRDLGTSAAVLDKVSETLAYVLSQYNEKGYYTFKDRNEIRCAEKAQKVAAQ